MTTVLRVYLIIGAIVLSFSAGFYTEYKFTQAALQKQTEARLKDVSVGTTKIIQFNNGYDHAIAGNKCADSAMPERLRKLLK